MISDFASPNPGQELRSQLRSPDFPLEVLDAHFVICLIVIIEPLAIAQAVYAFKFGPRVYAVREPLAFWRERSKL